MSAPRWGEEETNNPGINRQPGSTPGARSFFKVTQWTADGLHVACMPFAGTGLIGRAICSTP
jgi:hypothetical protein